jgi:ribosomal protein L11 methyltransferase
MDTLELTLALPASEHDRYLALLEAVATGFVQDDAALRAYVPTDRWAAADREALEARLAADGHPDALTTRALAAKNWNAVWQETLSPVRAGPFLLCPTSADVPSGQADATVLRIDPEMSFGTGHHATTRLALQLLAEGPLTGRRVLDVGTGTGVLAIAACRLGAAAALGVDTNPNAVRNARENIRRNDVEGCVTVTEGSMDVVPEMSYDLVTANITRRVLLGLLPGLCMHLTAGGTLVLSGLLRPQRDELIGATEAHALHLDAEQTEDGWWAARFTAPLP